MFCFIVYFYFQFNMVYYLYNFLFLLFYQYNKKKLQHETSEFDNYNLLKITNPKSQIHLKNTKLTQQSYKHKYNINNIKLNIYKYHSFRNVFSMAVIFCLINLRKKVVK